MYDRMFIFVLIDYLVFVVVGYVGLFENGESVEFGFYENNFFWFIFYYFDNIMIIDF